jgi:hypothetical protein
MHKLAIGPVVLAILLAITPAARAAAERPTYRMTTHYRVYWLGLPVFKGTVIGRNQGDRYALAFTSRSTGVLRIIQRSRIEASASGIVEPARYRALRFRLRANWERKRRSVDMRFAPNGSLRLRVSPREPGKRKPVSHPLAAAFDPLTALLHSTTVPLDTPACSLTVPIFDGRRRFDVRLEHAGTARLKRRVSPLLDRAAVKCRIHVRRIAGFTRKEIRDMDKAKDRTAVVWVAKLRRLKMWMPVRFSYMSRWGPATGRVVGIDIAPTAQTD